MMRATHSESREWPFSNTKRSTPVEDEKELIKRTTQSGAARSRNKVYSSPNGEVSGKLVRENSISMLFGGVGVADLSLMTRQLST